MGILDGCAGIPHKVVLAVVVGDPTDDERPHCAQVLDSMVLDGMLFDLDELEPESVEEMEVKEKLSNRFVESYGVSDTSRGSLGTKVTPYLTENNFS